MADLPVLRRARVVGIDRDDVAGDRLLALGFTPGTEVAFSRRAPWGGPLVIDVRGAQICLREREARRVRVVPLGDAP